MHVRKKDISAMLLRLQLQQMSSNFICKVNITTHSTGTQKSSPDHCIRRPARPNRSIAHA
ncbi:hypothetical protein Leryth_024114 [Lithospermum erythrorhizon]|nr:hypothetical protein Leryth_024114 [Lithospermum erythrorhizon]